MVDFAALKKMRANKNLAEIQETITKQNSGGQTTGKDDRFWSLDRDEAGNGSAVIRFLPKTEKDDLPWVRLFKHGFKGPTGKWYIENSLTTIGQNDPVNSCGFN